MTKKKSDDLEIELDGGGSMTMRELRRFIKVEKLSPADLFSEFDILEDPMMKKAVEQQTNFELEFRDSEAQKEIEKMDKEDKEDKDEIKDFDLLPEGSIPSGLEKRQEKKEKPEEGKEDDLFPPGDKGSSEDTEEDEGDQGEGGMLPG